MDGGDLAGIYAILLHIAFFGGAWLYSRYLNHKEVKIQNELRN